MVIFEIAAKVSGHFTPYYYPLLGMANRALCLLIGPSKFELGRIHPFGNCPSMILFPSYKFLVHTGKPFWIKNNLMK